MIHLITKITLKKRNLFQYIKIYVQYRKTGGKFWCGAEHHAQDIGQTTLNCFRLNENILEISLYLLLGRVSHVSCLLLGKIQNEKIPSRFLEILGGSRRFSEVPRGSWRLLDILFHHHTDTLEEKWEKYGNCVRNITH
jgi:hypothetical protein